MSRFEENPEWTAEDFAQAKLAGEVHPPPVVKALVRKGGRPRGTNKQQVSLRLDKDIVARFKEGGPGWQSRMNDALRAAVKSA